MDNSGNYISRDDGKVAAWEILEGMGYSSKHNDRLVEEVDAVFDEIPAADVRPVVRGKWEAHEAYMGANWCFWECSVCGDKSWTIKHNFCPNCGADMRPQLKEEGET